MRLYAALLRLYPASFRGAYGGEMRAIFARRRATAAGPAALAALWVAVTWEAVHGAALLHWDILLQDLRVTARSWRRSPGLLCTALPVLALGIGANAAAFSVADFVLLRPLPYPAAERLVKLWESRPGYSTMELSPANHRDWQRLARVFQSMGASHPESANLVGRGEPERLAGEAVTADLLPTLGVRPLLGRAFSAAEDRPGVGATLLLSYDLWKGEFGGDPGVLGRRVELDGTPHVILGVMPRGFQYPDAEARYWVPMRFADDAFADRNNNYLTVVARLAPGVSVTQAQAQMNLVAHHLERQYPGENRDTGAVVLRWRDELSSQARLLLTALCGAALCILLIACANLANLLLARALARSHELDVRAALGAGRERLVRQLATESLALAVLGGGLGLLAARAALPLLTRLVPTTLPLAEAPAIDARVLVFAVVLTALTGLGFGLAPALGSRRGAGFTHLRQGARTGGGRHGRLRAALVVAEVTASVVLLVAAGLLLRALGRVEATDPGFRAAAVATLRTDLPMPRYASTRVRAALYDRILGAVRALPGVTGAAYTSSVPMAWKGGIWPVTVAGRPADTAGADMASLRFLTAGYFATLGIPLVRGRDVADSDTADRPWVAVVSRSFAARFWPGQEPLGRHFQFGLHDRVVVGVAGDVRVRGLERTSEPQVYLPHQQVPDGWLLFYSPRALVVRTAAGVAAPLPAIRRIIRAADPLQPISDVRPLADVVAAETAPRTVQVRVLAALAGVAFLLAGIGIHGLLSFAVSQRGGEIGVRMALGATAPDILGLVLRRGALLGAAGILPGTLAAYAGGRAMAALLAGVEPGDAATFLAAGGLCLLMTLTGSLLPALRASRVDPAAVMRGE